MTTFVIPNFSAVIENPTIASEFSILGRMLSKAKKVECNGSGDAYKLISGIMAAPEDINLGVSALKQFSETNEATSTWSCCATPVVISPNRDHLDLEQVSGFDISYEEASHFCDEFNDYFKEDGFRFSFSTPDQWYCHFANEFVVSDASPFTIIGEDISQHIPLGKQGSMWRKLFNEMQMLLHHSATNQKRSLMRKPEINSFWFWGGGELIESFQGKNMQVFTDDLFTKGLALRSNCEVLPLKNPAFSDNSLYVCDLEMIDWLDWDKKYFEPAFSALKQGKIKKTTFYLGLNNKFELQKTSLLKFWLSEKPIVDLI